MRTREIQARNLHAGDSIVLGGDGVRRTVHPVGEKFTNGRTGSVTIRRRDGDVYAVETFAKTDRVRVLVP